MKTIQEWAEHYASMSKTKCMPDAILSVVADAVALEKQFASLIKQDVRQVAYDCDVGVLVVGEPAEFGKNRTLTVQASRPRLTVAC